MAGAVLDGLLYAGLGVLAAAALGFTWIHARRAWAMGRTSAVVAWIVLIPFTVLLAWALGLAAVGIAVVAVSVLPNWMTPAVWAVTLMLFADLVAIGALRRAERTHIRRDNGALARATGIFAGRTALKSRNTRETLGTRLGNGKRLPSGGAVLRRHSPVRAGRSSMPREG